MRAALSGCTMSCSSVATTVTKLPALASVSFNRMMIRGQVGYPHSECAVHGESAALHVPSCSTHSMSSIDVASTEWDWASMLKV